MLHRPATLLALILPLTAPPYQTSAVLYSGVPVVRARQVGRTLWSNTVRPWTHRACLTGHGARSIQVLSVHGFLMFGSVPHLTKAVRQLIETRASSRAEAPIPAGGDKIASTSARVEVLIEDMDPGGESGEARAREPWFVLIDLSACEGCDFGAMQEMVKMRSAVEAEGGHFRVTVPPAHSREAVERAAAGQLGKLDELQQTLRECEDSILCAHGFVALRPEAPPKPKSERAGERPGEMGSELAASGTSEADLAAVLCAVQIQNESTAAERELATLLLQHGTRRAVAEGEVVWEETSTADFFVYVLQGEFQLLHDGRKIEVVVPGATNGFLFMLFPPASGGRRDTILVGQAPQGSGLLVITREALHRLYAAHPHLERLMLTAMLARMAHEYHHWVRHHDHRLGPTS